MWTPIIDENLVVHKTSENFAPNQNSAIFSERGLAANKNAFLHLNHIFFHLFLTIKLNDLGFLLNEKIQLILFSFFSLANELS